MIASVSLPMYDLSEVRMCTNEVVSRIVAGLNRAGWPVMGHRGNFNDHAELVQHWRSPRTALSQACGLPYAEALADVVDVIGTIGWSNVSDVAGNYRSVIVVRSDSPFTMRTLHGARPVINNPGSLSGWWSLGASLHEHGYHASDFAPAVAYGAHARSLAALQAGRADVAAIDAATLQLLRKHRPSSWVGLRAIGEAPTIPATPLVVPKTAPLGADVIREVLAVAFASCSKSTREALCVTGFVPKSNADYAHLVAEPSTSLLPRVEVSPESEPT